MDFPQKKHFDKGLSFISNCSDEEGLLVLLQFLREKQQTKTEYLLVLDNMFHKLKDKIFLMLLYKTSRQYGFTIAITGDFNKNENSLELSQSSILISDAGISIFETIVDVKSQLEFIRIVSNK